MTDIFLVFEMCSSQMFLLTDRRVWLHSASTSLMDIVLLETSKRPLHFSLFFISYDVYFSSMIQHTPSIDPVKQTGLSIDCVEAGSSPRLPGILTGCNRHRMFESRRVLSNPACFQVSVDMICLYLTALRLPNSSCFLFHSRQISVCCLRSPYFYYLRRSLLFLSSPNPTTMDVSTMDLLSARVALEADITDIDNQLRATRNIRWSRQQEFALRTRKAKCERQLEELNIQIKVYALIESECNDIFTGLELGDSRKQELLDQGLAILLGDVSLGSAKPGPRELAATDPDGDFVPRSKSSSMIGNVSSVSSVSSDDDEFYDADEGYSNFYTQGVESGDTLLTCGICESTWVYQTFGLVCPACHSDAKRVSPHR